MSDGGNDGYCALLSTGGVDCWGDNLDGELGNGTTGGPDGEDGYDTPQAVTGITNAVSVTSSRRLRERLLCAALDRWGGLLGGTTITASWATGPQAGLTEMSATTRPRQSPASQRRLGHERRRWQRLLCSALDRWGGLLGVQPRRAVGQRDHRRA